MAKLLDKIFGKKNGGGANARVAVDKNAFRVRHSLYDEDLLEAFRDEYYGFRRLRGSVYLQDILPIDKLYMSRIVRALFYVSPTCKRIIQTPIVWYFSGGLNVVGGSKKIDKICKNFVNDYGKFVKEAILSFMLDGELVIPILVLKNRLIDYGYVDGLNIADVIFDDNNALYPKEIQYYKPSRTEDVVAPMSQEKHTLKCLRRNEIDSSIYDGSDYCLYFRENNMPTYRGRSFVEQVLDAVYNYDNFIQDIIVQNQFMGAVLWDITINGASKQEVDARQQELVRRPPPPGSFIVHNENEVWQLVEKKYHGEMQKIDSDIILRHIALGAMVDPSWLGVDTRDDTYFQTTKFFEFIFNIYTDIVRKLVKNYLIAHQYAGLLSLRADVDDFVVNNASHNIILFKQTAITFTQLSNGLKVATDNGWIDETTASKVLHEALNISWQNIEVEKTLDTVELMSIINTLLSAYNSGIVNPEAVKETIEYYINKSNFELKGGQFMNPSGLAPRMKTGLQGERVEPTGGG